MVEEEEGKNNNDDLETETGRDNVLERRPFEAGDIDEDETTMAALCEQQQ